MTETPFVFINTTTTDMEEDIAVKKEPLEVYESKLLTDQNKCGEIFAIYSGHFVLICGFCQKSFENMMDFGIHVQDKHKDNMLVISDYLKSNQLPEENVLKTDTNFDCNHKEESLHSFEDVLGFGNNVCSDEENTEIKFSREEESGTYICDRCGERYPSESALYYHYTVTCSKPVCKTENDCLPKIKSARKRKSRKRDGCLDEQSKNENGELHLLQEDKSHNSKRQFPCESCDRIFTSKRSLTYHANREHPKKTTKDTTNSIDEPQPLRCKFCNQEFATKPECTEHENSHTGDKPYVCCHCNLTFKTSSGRKRHIRIHTGKRPFPCKECPKGFDNKDQLDAHIRQHKNPRKFTCQTCGESFFRRFQLGLHEQRRHTGFRPLVCEDCGKSFVTMGELTQHRIRHSDVKDWKCEVCGKCFYSKWALKDHMAGHSDAKPFACEVCGRLFSRPKALKKHKKLHSDVKAYVCNICGKAYAQDSGLYAHKKTHGIRSSQ